MRKDSIVTLAGAVAVALSVGNATAAPGAKKRAPRAIPKPAPANQRPAKTNTPVVNNRVPTKNRAAVIWQGFEVEWLRQAAGFRTPHRFGSFTSRTTAQNHTLSQSSWRATANAKFEFSPGVDGDYARPILRYALAYGPKVAVTTGSVNFSFTDDVTGDYDNPNSSGRFPKAESRKHKREWIKLGKIHNHGGYDNYAVVLRGVTIGIECVEGQPGHACNSDGIWPHRMYFSVDNCSEKGGTLKCDFDLELFRSWTPDKGGGKALNDKMAFDVDIHYTIVGGNDGDFHAGDTKRITRSGTTGGSAATSMAKVRKTETRTITGRPGYDHATMGLTAFGFELSKSGSAKNRGHLGRYISGLQFTIADRGYDRSAGAMDWSYAVALWAPTTVNKSNVTYELRGKLLQFGAGSEVTSSAKTGAGPTEVWLDRSATGTACVEGPFFENCAGKGMPESASSTASIAVTTPL